MPNLHIFQDGEVLKAETLNTLITELADRMHPVGSYYWSDRPTDPSQLFGGRWERIQNRFIFAASYNHPAGQTGGAETHQLTISEMPAHAHGLLLEGQGSQNSGLKFNGAYARGGYFDGSYTQSTGGSQAFSIMPPYITAYCWKRIS